MLTSYLKSFKTWVMAKNSETPEIPEGQLVDFVIHADSGKFEALWVRTPEGYRLLSPRDIVNWAEDEILISESHDILDPEDFPRMETLMKQEVPILGASVFQMPGRQPQGKVIDFGFDTIAPKILSLTVRSGFWIFGEDRIIPREAIKKITPEGIFISQPLAKIKKDQKSLKRKTRIKKIRTDFQDHSKE